MKYNLSNEKENQTAYIQFNHLLQNGRLIELREIKKTRTTLQNAALHQFFVLISQELNNLGLEFIYVGIKGTQLSTIYTPDIVKNYIWRPIQITLFNIKSTKKLSTHHINHISDVIIKFFGEKDIYINFPNWQDKTRQYETDRNNQ